MFIVIVIGIFNVLTTFICYFILRRKRALFGDRYAASITKAAVSVSALVVGIHISSAFTIQPSFIVLCSIMYGGVVGILFGALVKFHSILLGFYQGVLGSIMGVMIGEVLKNPQLCSIPLASAQQQFVMIYQMCGFSSLLLLFVFMLILYSLRV